jgi:hypothetical protein
MPSFSFDIEDVFELGDGFKGITLTGPPVATSGSLDVGDTLLVPTGPPARTLPGDAAGMEELLLESPERAWDPVRGIT